jgi:hypothetical protein
VILCEDKVPVELEETEVVVPDTVDGIEEEEPLVVELLVCSGSGTLGKSDVSGTTVGMGRADGGVENRIDLGTKDTVVGVSPRALMDLFLIGFFFGWDPDSIMSLKGMTATEI